jgi:hypothetical protein
VSKYNGTGTTEEGSMKTSRRLHPIVLQLVIALGLGLLSQPVFGQPPQRADGNGGSRGPGKPVTVPVSIRLKEEVVELQNIDLSVSEDGEPQTIISIRGNTNSPITIAVLIQEDLVPSVGTEIKGLAEFIRKLPKNSRVMVGYLRTGTIQVKQKFTNDLEKAASSLRPPAGFASVGPYNPYVEVIEALKKFESQPLGRRAILLVSDGLDIARGVESSSPTQSIDLQRAINESQRRGVSGRRRNPRRQIRRWWLMRRVHSSVWRTRRAAKLSSRALERRSASSHSSANWTCHFRSKPRSLSFRRT